MHSFLTWRTGNQTTNALVLVLAWRKLNTSQIVSNINLTQRKQRNIYIVNVCVHHSGYKGPVYIMLQIRALHLIWTMSNEYIADQRTSMSEPETWQPRFFDNYVFKMQSSLRMARELCYI
jgi:lysine/ornithine N-monooxygenase